MDVINKLVETLTDTGKGVMQKAKDVAEVSKIHNQISVEESRIMQHTFPSANVCMRKTLVR